MIGSSSVDIQSSANKYSEDEIGTDLKIFLKEQFDRQDAELKSMNELLRRNMATTKIISKNLSAYFNNLNISYRHEFEELLPVKTIDGLKSLNMQCLNAEFRQKLVSNKYIHSSLIADLN